MFTQDDYDLAERLYTPPPSTVVATPNSPHPLEVLEETQESRVTGGEYLHELLDRLLESEDPLAIEHGIRAYYMNWLTGDLPLDRAVTGLNRLVWGASGERYPFYPKSYNGALRLAYNRITKDEAQDLIARMTFPGAILFNRVEGDMDYGSIVYIVTEGYGERVMWGSGRERTIARLIVGAYGLNFTLNMESMLVHDEFMGLTFEEKFKRPVTPWDRVGDSTTIELH